MSKRKIIAACDLSEYSGPVIRCALELAEGLHAQLTVVNVINQRDIDAIRYAVTKLSATIQTESAEECIEDMRRTRHSAIKKLLAGVPYKDIPVKIEISSGVPVNELVTFAGEENVSFVVIGTKGRSNIANLLLGSTAEKMFRLCPVPLVSVRLSRDIDRLKTV